MWRSSTTKTDDAERDRQVTRGVVSTVVTHPRQAREQNIVDIRINGVSFRIELSKDLREAYGLERRRSASVFRLRRQPREAPKDNVARWRGSAPWRSTTETARRRAGVAGRVDRMAIEEMPRGSVRNPTICQMIGSIGSPLPPAAERAPTESPQLGAECYTLHARVIRSSKEIVETLRKESSSTPQLQAHGTDQGAVSSATVRRRRTGSVGDRQPEDRHGIDGMVRSR